MTSLLLRPVASPDLPALLPLMAEFYQHFGYPYDAATQQAVAAEFLAHPEWGRLYLLEDDGRTVGYVALSYGFSFERRGRFGLVDELYVSATARSRGVGRAALRALQVQARAEGLEALHLQTEPGNTRAKQLYESLGFVDDGRRNLIWDRDNSLPAPTAP